MQQTGKPKKMENGERAKLTTSGKTRKNGRTESVKKANKPI